MHGAFCLGDSHTTHPVFAIPATLVEINEVNRPDGTGLFVDPNEVPNRRPGPAFPNWIQKLETEKGAVLDDRDRSFFGYGRSFPHLFFGHFASGHRGQFYG